MATRNFWIEVDVDGKKRIVKAGGPRAADGGFYLSVQMRDGGARTLPLEIVGEACKDGRLLLAVKLNGKPLALHKTRR